MLLFKLKFLVPLLIIIRMLQQPNPHGSGGFGRILQGKSAAVWTTMTSSSLGNGAETALQQQQTCPLNSATASRISKLDTRHFVHYHIISSSSIPTAAKEF